MPTRVTDTDKGARALLRRLEAAKNRTITVGVHDVEAAAPEGPTTVGDIATIHEFGLGHQEPRPFVSGWADGYAATHQDNMRKLGVAVVKGSVASVDQGLAQLAELYAGEMKGNFPNLPAVPSKPGGTPLVETGQLRSAIRGEVSK